MRRVLFRPEMSEMKRLLPRRGAVIAAFALAAVSLAGISSPAVSAPAASLPKLKTSKAIRIGFFPNVTHAAALVAQQRKTIDKALAAEGTTVQWVSFNAGPSAIEALKGGSIDASFIGPNPAVSGYVSTRGSLLRIVSGVTNAGAQFITKQSITTVADLAGKTFATPQLGNTQDVALRAYLKSKGYNTSVLGGGDVNIVPTSNATTLTLFKSGQIDGAWVPEPWASRLVLEGNGRVFLDEKSLWPKGRFATTVLIANATYLKSYPGTVRTTIRALSDTMRWMGKNPALAKDATQAQLLKWSGAKLSDDVINRAWANFGSTVDPIAKSLERSVDDAVDVGVLTNLGSRGVNGIYDLRLLNQLQAFFKRAKVSAHGLGLD